MGLMSKRLRRQSPPTHAPRCRMQPGCRQFDVCRDPADSQVFFLYELYDDAAAIAAHLQTPHSRQMDVLTASWVAHKTVRQMQRVAP